MRAVGSDHVPDSGNVYVDKSVFSEFDSGLFESGFQIASHLLPHVCDPSGMQYSFQDPLCNERVESFRCIVTSFLR